MEEILTGNDALKASFELGYICKNGEMFSPKGNKVGRVERRVAKLSNTFPLCIVKILKKITFGL